MNAPIWFANFVLWSAQVAVLVFAAWLLVQLLRIREPRVLLVFWRVLFAASLLLPVIQPWHRPDAAQAPGAVVTDFTAPVSTSAVSPVASHWRLPGLFVAAEIVGVALVAVIAVRFAIFVLGLFRLRQLRADSSPIRAEASCESLLRHASALVGVKAEFRTSADVGSPVTFGFARPIALLPERFLSLDERLQTGIACHELLHVRRRDWAHHLAEEIVRAVFWFHPAVIWLVSRVRLAREQVVDLEVVRLTQARKPYLEALLEFATGAGCIAAIPAPPFLIERQLAERVALMLKEARMSRTRLIASLGAIACMLCIAAVAVVWAFPLKAAARVPQAAAEGAAAQGVANQFVMEIKVTAKAKDGSALIGLTTGDFVLFEDGAQQKIESVIAKEFSTGPGYVVSFLSSKESDSTFRHIDVRLASKWGAKGQDYTLASGEAAYSKLAGGIAEGVSSGISDGISNGVAQGVSGGIAQGISSGVSGGISSGISQGVSRGVSSGVSDGIAGDRRIRQTSATNEPVVNEDTLWTFPVRRGSMPLQVGGQGTLLARDDGRGFITRIEVPSTMASNIELGQAVDVISPGPHHADGRVTRIDRSASNDETTVDIELLRPASPEGMFPGTKVDVFITTGQLEDVLYMGRPVHTNPNSSGSIFKIAANGAAAERVSVSYGRASVNEIQILSGLKEGDIVILSDMSPYDDFNRIQIKR